VRREEQIVGQFGHSLYLEKRRQEFGPVSSISSEMRRFWTKKNFEKHLNF
jgi:hypothetical protein